MVLFDLIMRQIFSRLILSISPKRPQSSTADKPFVSEAICLTSRCWRIHYTAVSSDWSGLQSTLLQPTIIFINQITWSAKCQKKWMLYVKVTSSNCLFCPADSCSMIFHLLSVLTFWAKSDYSTDLASHSYNIVWPAMEFCTPKRI